MLLDSLEIAYDDTVLAPRPWTLAQAQWGADLWQRGAGGPVLELCSGVGHIGLALAARVPASLVMVEASPTACAFAEANAAAAGLTERVEVRCGLMAATVGPAERFAVILADPPWVPTAAVDRFPEDPAHAIDGGADGLDLVRACLQLIERHLDADGHAVLQVGPGQITAVRDHLDATTGLHLAATTARAYGRRGALVLLSRRR